MLAAGRLIFAVAVTALGVENVVCARFAQGVVPALPFLRPLPGLAYGVGGALIAAGVGIALRLRPREAATLLGILLLVCALAFPVPEAVARPFDLGIRTTVFEVLAFCGAALALARTFAPARGGLATRAGFLDCFLQSGRYIFAVSSVVFGVSHLLIPRFIASLIPAWIPGPLFWAYFTGVAFIATGISIAAGIMDRPAAILLGAMFLLWFACLHAPRVSSAPRSHNPNEWSSAFIALGMCGGCWIIAGESSQRRGMQTSASENRRVLWQVDHPRL
jgi:uncharacterized membrane protein YphA (DoxX/SURF4 family)